MKQIRWLLAHRRLRIWLMLIGVVIALIGFEEVADDVFSDPSEGDHEAQHFDQAVGQYARGFRTDGLNQVMTDLTALGSVSVIVTLFVIFVSVLMIFRDWKGIAFISAVLAGGGLWPALLKMFFQRGRPEESDWIGHVSGLSFPSGHSFGAAAAYIGFAYYASLYARSWKQETFFYVLGGLLAATVGVSRIYLGVHFPTDVLAGLSGGVAWALLAAATYEFFFHNRHKKLQAGS